MKLTWPHVAVVGIFVVGITVLGITGRDTAPLIALGSAVLIGAGLVGVVHQQGEIKASTNGNTSRLVSLLEAMSRQLAQMQPQQQRRSDTDDDGS